MEEIIGGVKSSRYRFKYVAALMYKSAEVPDINPCTASILSNFHIITVADCFYTKPWGQLRDGYFYIIAGAPDLKEPLQYTRYIGIDTVTIHKHYNPLDLDSFYSKANLAIGKLKTSLEMKGKHPAISSLVLRYKELSMPFPALFVSGYGLHEVELVIAEVMGRHDYLQLGESDGKLRYGIADLLNFTYCEGIIGKSLVRGNLCAKMQRKEPEQPTGICLGDSGAPLVLRDYLIGIAINGFLSCDEEEYPGIYVDAYYYRTFISSVLDNFEYSEKYVFQIQEHQPNIFKFVQFVVETLSAQDDTFSEGLEIMKHLSDLNDIVLQIITENKMMFSNAKKDSAKSSKTNINYILFLYDSNFILTLILKCVYVFIIFFP